MWLDAVLAVIFAFSAAQGSRAGFVRTLVHAVGWIASILFAFFCYPYVSGFLREHTHFYDDIHDRILLKLTGETPVSGEQITGGFPSILQNIMDSTRDTMTSALATGLSSILFHIITFLVIALALRLLFLVVSTLLGKRRKGGITGFADGFMGMIIGAIRGIFLVFLFLALLIPVVNLSSGTEISTALETSLFAGTLYNNNLLLLIMKDLL